ncbi:MAG: peptidylprolyl isomerase [Coriobacteriia bacterium]|nr:peptidylprolyl isomerase [Coriobacteriia bacterium]
MRTAYNVLLPLTLAILLVFAVLALPGCSTRAEEPVLTPPANTPAEQSETEPSVPEEDPLYTAEYTPTGTEVAVITTPKGIIKFEFYPDDAPNTVAAFIERADEGFYDGTKFHRVEPGFVIQGGDPLSKTDDAMVGTGGPGYQLKAEFNDRSHLDGTVAMARSQHPDSAGSQFYICLGPQPFLDNQYTVFGQVTEGMDVVRQIAVGDVMESVRIERSE